MPTLSRWKTLKTYTKYTSITKQLFIFKIAYYFTKGSIVGSIKYLHVTCFDKDFPKSTAPLLWKAEELFRNSRVDPCRFGCCDLRHESQ